MADFSEQWTENPMDTIVGTDTCPLFTTSIPIDPEDMDKTFRWGVVLDGNGLFRFWGGWDVNSAEQYLKFRIQRLDTEGLIQQIKRYYLTYCRRIGANRFIPKGAEHHLLHFAVWAPNAQAVSVVFGQPNLGYIDDKGIGINDTSSVVTLTQFLDGVWEGEPEHPYITFQGLPYMYRILNKQGKLVYRTDISLRSQLGKGGKLPPDWDRNVEQLDSQL
jgi:1,4-alpha-glucan branching enzyme